MKVRVGILAVMGLATLCAALIGQPEDLRAQVSAATDLRALQWRSVGPFNCKSPKSGAIDLILGPSDPKLSCRALWF